MQSEEQEGEEGDEEGSQAKPKLGGGSQPQVVRNPGEVMKCLKRALKIAHAAQQQASH